MHYPLHISSKTRKAHFNDAQLYFTTGYNTYLCYVIFYAHTRSDMDGVRSLAFKYFYEKSSLILVCFIFQSLSKYRKAALKFVFRFLLVSLTGVTLCN